MNTIKVLVADDSMLMRVLIKDILCVEESIEVIGTANNGQDAFLLTQQLCPDIVLMDLNMGEYDGLHGIKQIMQHCPTPILILSTVGNSNMDAIMEGLHAGAFDYLNKPAKNNTALRDIEMELIKKIKEVSAIKPRLNPSQKQETNSHKHSFNEELQYDVIVIGASTGGPTAIEAVITNLPANLPVPVLMVQHMPQHFIGPFAERLNKLTPLPICVAQKGDIVEKGKILLAPGDKNMILKAQEGKVEVDFTYKKCKAYNYPSVDSLMLSVAEIYGKHSIAVILTGMGSDGAEGMKAIKDAGGYTLIQSRETCVVFGMPRVAMEIGAAISEVKINEIGGFLVSCLS